MPEPAIRLSGVTKRFGDRLALDRIDFQIAPGEAVGYLGPNGAGKSTTMKLLVGLGGADEGTVEIGGCDPGRQRLRALTQVGALVETPGTLPFMHGRDLLDHVAEVRGMPVLDRGRAVRSTAGSVGVEEQLDRPMGVLSTGQVRRLLLAAALIGDPRVLLLDEPTLGLDPAGRRDLRELIRGLHREGRTILLSTHLLDDVETVCGRVIFLREGRVVGDEPVRRLEAQESSATERSLSVRFGSEISASAMEAALGNAVSIVRESARDWRIEFHGDEPLQSELIARLIRAGLPVVRAAPPESDLSRRYLEIVGREGA